MASRREEIIQAWKALFTAALPNGKVERNLDTPMVPHPGGTIIIRDGNPGDPIQVLMSPLTYTYAHPIPVEVVAPAGTTPETRSEALDAILIVLGGVIEANPTLGGLCEWAEPTTPDTDDVNPASTQPARWAGFEVVTTYSTSNPLA